MSMYCIKPEIEIRIEGHGFSLFAMVNQHPCRIDTCSVVNGTVVSLIILTFSHGSLSSYLIHPFIREHPQISFNLAISLVQNDVISLFIGPLF